MIDKITEYLNSLSVLFPTELFVIIGSFIEEVLTPIPSPVVLTLAGTLSKTQNHTIIYLVLLSLLSSAAKTLASWFFYILADKGEDFILKRFGKYIGVSHQQIESDGKFFNGSWKDDLILFVARALPVIPTSLISVACGLIKINIKTFISSTFFGYAVRSFFFLYIGYAGIETYDSLSKNLNSFQSILKIIAVVIFLILTIAWFVYKKRIGGIDNFLKKFRR